MGLFSKINKQAEAKTSTRSVTYPIEVRSWSIHVEGIRKLLEATGTNLNECKVSEYLRCKVVPEPDNESDPNALKVYAAPKGRSKEFFDIGYVPSEFAPDMRGDVKKVVAGSHYWSLLMRFDVFEGISFSLKLEESKFK
jgi:hypothetical protein